MDFYISIGLLMSAILVASIFLSITIIKNEVKASKDHYHKKDKLLLGILLVYNVMIAYALFMIYQMIFGWIP